MSSQGQAVGCLGWSGTGRSVARELNGLGPVGRVFEDRATGVTRADPPVVSEALRQYSVNVIVGILGRTRTVGSPECGGVDRCGSVTLMCRKPS